MPRRAGGCRPSRRRRRQCAGGRLPRFVAAALAMGGLLWLSAALVLPLAASAHGIARAVLLGVLISGGIAVYGLLLGLFGVTGWNEAVSALRQSPARDLRD